ncbi:MAG: lytic murein transglycosylase B [Rhodanobacteraceae bacterium]|nr:lytic murein transglycosylase B [Rhodanobacteraceae bacterium]
MNGFGMTALLRLVLIVLVASVPSLAGAKTRESHPGANALLRELRQETHADRATVQRWRTLLAQAKKQDSILVAISRPAEKTKPWKDYRPIFMTAQRRDAGIAFYRDNQVLLDQVAHDTGVPAEIIVAIIGVETSYGRITGSYKVIDALTTLALYYPPRAPFFRGELKQLLKLDGQFPQPLEELKGSYAGAMGWGQFMPTSFAQWAKDGDGDGRIDLWASKPDIVHSVANYFVAHGWTRGAPVTGRAIAAPDATLPEIRATETIHSIDTLAKAGYTLAEQFDGTSPATLLVLDGAEGTEHWITFQNFYVISRYNRSPLYSMAVWQLAQEIARGATATP